MTICHAIARYDTLYPNTFAYHEKLRWLSELDGVVFNDILSAYSDSGITEFEGYDIRTDKHTDLLVPFPYDDIYIKYLSVMCDSVNGDSIRYQNSYILFNTAYSRFADYWNRTHRAKETKIKI